MALTVGQIGAGVVASWHLQGYVAAPGVDAVVLAEPDTAARRRLYDQYGIIKQVHEDYQALLDDPQVGIIDICAPVEQRAEIAIAALQAGKHVICEQPPASTMAEFEAMQAAAAAGQGRLFVAIPELMIPANERARELIHQGEVGEVLLVGALVVDNTLDSSSIRQSIYAAMAMLQRWLGPAAAVSMTAKRVAGEAAAGPEDTALINMEMAAGALAQIAVTCAAAGDEPTTERRIVGTKGTLLVRDDPEDELPLVGFEEKMFFSIPVHNPPHIREYATRQLLCDFVDCIIEGKAPAVSLQETEAALRTLLAAYESVESGRRVAIAR